MPLSEGESNAARQENIKTEIAAGKPVKQAAAIAYSKQRENKRDNKTLIKDLKDSINNMEK